MRLPDTLDRIRRGVGAVASGPPVEDDGREPWLDPDDDLDADWEWEWVEVDDGDADVDGGATPQAVPRTSPPRSRRWRRSSDRVVVIADDGLPEDAPIRGRGRRASTVPDVDPRIAARRDDVAQAHRIRRRRRLIALGVVAAVVLGLGALTRSAALDVDTVTVIGAERSDPDELAAASGIAPGTPLLGLDLEAAADALRAQPWVRDATVDRTWSGEITATVVEREPLATINAGDGGWLVVDRDRRVVAVAADPPDLPIVDGVGTAEVGEELAPEAQAAIDVAGALPPGVRTRVAVVHGANPGAIELTLQPTGRVEFGPATALDQRMRSLTTVFAQVDLVCLATLDLQVPDRAVLTRVPACE